MVSIHSIISNINIEIDTLIILISNLGGNVKYKHFRTIEHLTHETVSQNIVKFATEFDLFAKEFIYARYAHCPETLLIDTHNPQNNIAKLLNMTIVTKGQPLETLAHFVNIIDKPGFAEEYLEFNDKLQSDMDIAINYAFIQEFRNKFDTYSETWFKKYFRKLLYFIISTILVCVLIVLHFIMLIFNGFCLLFNLYLYPYIRVILQRQNALPVNS